MAATCRPPDVALDPEGQAWWLCRCGTYEYGYASKRAARRGWEDHRAGLDPSPARSAARREEETAGAREYGRREAARRHAMTRARLGLAPFRDPGEKSAGSA